MTNVFTAFHKIQDYFSPRVVAEVEDMYVKLAKIKGDDIPWHSHEHEDELFHVLEGEMMIHIKGQAPFRMTKGDIYVVPKSIEHRVYSEEECLIMLIESKSTAHTGKVQSQVTKTIDDQLKSL